MPIIDTNKRFIEIMITQEDHMLTRDMANPEPSYLDSPYGFLVERVEGATEEETRQLSKERFLGRITRGAAIPDMLAFESSILIGMAVANGNKRVHLMMGDPGVGKTYEYTHLQQATGWHAVQVNSDLARNADEFFIQPTLSDGTSPSLSTRLSNALLKGEGITPENRQTLKTILGKVFPMQENGLPDYLKFTEEQSTKFEEKLPVWVEGYLNKMPQKSSVGYKKGVLLEALIEARKNPNAPLLINMDEANYYQYGAISREFIAFMNEPSQKKFLVKFQDVDGNHVEEQFTRDQLKHVQVMMTCNVPDREREPNAKQQSDSLQSRLQSEGGDVHMGPMAYAHRLTSEWMGLPLTTLSNVAQNHGLAGEKLHQFLEQRITLGMTEEELKMASKATMANAMLSQAANVCLGIQHLGAALYELNVLLMGDAGDEVRQKMGNNAPKMDGRFINTLYEYMCHEVNIAPQPQDKSGKIISGENPYRIYDKNGKQILELTPEKMGERAVNALVLFLNRTFKVYEPDYAEFRQEIGEILARNKVLTLDDAGRIFGAQERVTELQSNGKGATNIDETVEGLINVAPPRFKAEEIVAATEYLYTIIARQYPNLVEGRDRDEFKDLMLTPVKVAALMNQYGLQYDGLGVDAGAVIPGVKYDGKTFSATLREPDIRMGTDAAKAMANQPEKEAGIRALLLGAMARSEGQPNPLDALFKTTLTHSEVRGFAANILNEFYATQNASDEKWRQQADALKEALAEKISPLMQADTRPEKAAVEAAVQSFLSGNKKAVGAMLKTDQNQMTDQIDVQLRNLFQTGKKSPQISGADAPLTMATMMYAGQDDLGFRVIRYRIQNGESLYSIGSDLPLGLSDEAKKTLETRGIRVFELAEEQAREAFLSQVQYQLQGAVARPLENGETPDEPKQQRRLHALLEHIRSFADIGGSPVLDAEGKRESYEALGAEHGVILDNALENLAKAAAVTIADGRINPGRARFVYADKEIATAAAGAGNLSETASASASATASKKTR